MSVLTGRAGGPQACVGRASARAARSKQPQSILLLARRVPALAKDKLLRRNPGCGGRLQPISPALDPDEQRVFGVTGHV